MHRAVTLLLVCAVLGGGPAEARRKSNQLLRVIAPTGKTNVPAHPFVNVVVGIGATDKAVPDPGTFRARMGGVNITPLFVPVTGPDGTIAGMRAAVGPALLNIGSHRGNRLRVDLHGHARKGGARVRDIDRFRFRAVDVADEPPVARALSAGEIILPGIPIQFDATQSHDPESDELTYAWDFGDGEHSTDPRPMHTFAPTALDVMVRLTVSDGQLAGDDELTMVAIPPLAPGRTPGVLSVDAASVLEFGGVALGGSSARTFMVRNTDNTPTSELRVRLGVCRQDFATGLCVAGSEFSLSAVDLDLAAGESASVDLGYGPTIPGHQSALVTMVASASNQSVAHLLGHGYGGDAPGTGPLPIAATLFYNSITGTAGIAANGTRFIADNTVFSCQVAQNGPGTGDACVTDADCAPNHGTCPQPTCSRGDRVGQPCASANDCPNGSCPAASGLDPIDMCGDGEGGLYLLSDDGTFTDPSPGDTELGGTLMHVRYDPNGNRTSAEIVKRTTSGTEQLACDKISAAAGGEIYLAQFQAVTGPQQCFRDSREALLARRKGSGVETVLLPRIDAAEGLDVCNDDYDPADDLEVTPDGSAAFVALPNGIFRIRPTSLLITPDVDPDIFQVHPDGSVLIAVSSDQGPTGLLRLYKISPDQAASGGQHLTDLTPCATVKLPNNGGRSFVVWFASAPVQPGSLDATVLLSFSMFSRGSAVSNTLLPRGTIAISSPAGGTSCTVLGLLNLEALDQMTF